MESVKVNPTELVEQFNDYNHEMVEKLFPTREIKVSKSDKPWMNEELKNIRRQKQRTYRKEGISKKYEELQRKFDELKQKEIRI